MRGIYGKQVASGQFDFSASLFGLPFLIGTCVLVSMCVLSAAGQQTVTRTADQLSVFTGVGWIGWTRRFRWSDFQSVREDLTVNGWNRNRRVIVMEGQRRVTFGSMWTDDRRYFVLSAIRRMLDVTSRAQASAIMPPRFG